MSFRKVRYLLLSGLGALLLAAVILMWPTANAGAQCGSQASSCKNCHEVQAKDPVNNDGTGWHVSHAFGDFCYICHAGNNQSMDKVTAHTGMVDPMSDVKAACQSCHPNDLMERAQVYATTLGITVGEAAAAASEPTVSASGTMTQTLTTGAAAGSSAGSGGQAGGGTGRTTGGSELVTGSNEVVDYNQRYAETVLGQRLINWGNVILVILIVLLILGGGVFVFYNERKRRGLSMGKAKAATPASAEAEMPVIEGYSPEVVALLPKIARLNPTGLHALKRLLENPENASELLHTISKLDPELVNQVRGLDRPARELLLAMSGD